MQRTQPLDCVLPALVELGRALSQVLVGLFRCTTCRSPSKGTAATCRHTRSFALCVGTGSGTVLCDRGAVRPRDVSSHIQIHHFRFRPLCAICPISRGIFLGAPTPRTDHLTAAERARTSHATDWIAGKLLAAQRFAACLSASARDGWASTVRDPCRDRGSFRQPRCLLLLGQSSAVGRVFCCWDCQPGVPGVVAGESLAVKSLIGRIGVVRGELRAVNSSSARTTGAVASILCR
mmetsp:Transcript_90978/g.195067  ORF Transcript_90978/g.195067 Transcript_90978/m.195067 type:complete len:235 (+) Transcript_90978:329-1033(+)